MSDNDCVSITWAINNFSHFWQKKNEAIISPEFFIYMPEESKWNLLLFPRGTKEDNLIAFFLYRSKDCCGTEIIEVEYILQVLSADGSVWTSVSRKNEFRKDIREGSDGFLFLTDVITIVANKYLTQDTLTLRCRITRIESKTLEIRQIYARTIISVEKRVFLWPVEKFSNLSLNQKQTSFIQLSSKELVIQIDLNVNKDPNDEDKIYLNFCCLDQRVKFSVVKTFIIDSQKQKVDVGEYKFGDSVMFPLNLSKAQLMDFEKLYLPNDTLTLSFELISTGFAFEGIEKIVCGHTSHLCPNVVTENRRKYDVQEKISVSSCALITDLTSLYEDKTNCDMKLQTKTSVFPVHTLILGARSPVFKAMFSSEMKEKINGYVDVSDLDDETVRKFLLYMYTDQLEDIKWDDAVQLYETADKYAVVSLKEKCASILKTNLNLKNACEALVLSDLHQDKDLKLCVQNFILNNAKTVFMSEEWKLLGDTNSKVVVETMLRNWSDE